MIELALDRVGRTALVEAENFVAEVQPVSHDAEALVQPVATLNVILRVCVKVLISVGALKPSDGIVRSAIVHPEIRVDAGVVVTHGETHREARLVIRESEVPIVRSLAWQGRMIGPARSEERRVGKECR